MNRPESSQIQPLLAKLFGALLPALLPSVSPRLRGWSPWPFRFLGHFDLRNFNHHGVYVNRPRTPDPQPHVFWRPGKIPDIVNDIKC